MIAAFTINPDLTERYIDLEYSVYRGDKRWIAPIRKHRVRRMVERSIMLNSHQQPQCRHFLASTNGSVLGRVSAFANPDLKHPEGHRLGAIGAYECVDDASVAGDLIGCAVRWLREEFGYDRIWGPLNYDIWSGYRFMTEGFETDPFYGEPYNKPWYPRQFQQAGFEPLKDWLSMEANEPETLARIYSRGEQRYHHFLDLGFRFRPLSKVRYARDEWHLYRVLTKAFSNFPGYTSLTYEQFAARYRDLKKAVHWKTSGFALDEAGDPIAFLITFRDLAPAVRSMSGNLDLAARLHFLKAGSGSDRLVSWLLGVADPHRREWAGIGRSLGYWMYLRLRSIRPNRYLVALMSADGPVQAYMQCGCSAERRYTLYQLGL